MKRKMVSEKCENSLQKASKKSQQTLTIRGFEDYTNI